MAKSAYFDLTTKIISIEETNPDLLNTWLGGRGLGAAILYDRVGPSVKPFDPQNCLIFTTAHLSATAWPASSRYHVTFKSPATGAYGYANAGGYFGSELRKAGYDALIVTGKADEPVMIKVQQDGIEILPATDLWGLSTSAVDSLLRENQGGRVACIGQAGENLVYMASIMNDHGRAAARGGPGAVMGSKLLKAVHVIAPARRTSRTAEGFAEAAKKASQYVINHPRMQRLMSESTLFLMQAKQYIGDLPAKNHQVSSVPFIDKVDTKSFSRYWKKRTGCAACPIRCSRYIELENGQETISFEGPEYESTNALGPMCWNADPEVVIRANDLCNQYGLDTISTGVTIAFAMECHQRGLLND
jgi:aldehyde:ferredoxin oxidoreductase